MIHPMGAYSVETVDTYIGVCPTNRARLLHLPRYGITLTIRSKPNRETMELDGVTEYFVYIGQLTRPTSITTAQWSRHPAASKSRVRPRQDHSGGALYGVRKAA